MSGKRLRKHQKKEQSVDDESEQKVRVIEIWENTYRMEPQKYFKSYLAKRKIQQVFDKYLTNDLEYSSENTPLLCEKISNEVRDLCKELDINRYKIGVQTFIGEISGQSIMLGGRFLWNNNTDNFTSLKWKNDNIFVTTIVFATYLE
mmetsp:Transcript_107165/g.130757  ORF Transcript_107165/g.130757 Transcript_107165/m.130757 type:complete len:147 (-) Transcript_107165:9-449(-)